jgi:glycosyltransferase involved in cell wall biosynthesis
MYVNSEVTQRRLRTYNGFESKVLHPPLNDQELFRPLDDRTGDYLFCGGRINGMKRHHLVVEAMRYVPAPAKLIVAGPADTAADARRLQALVEQHGLGSRVHLDIDRHPRPRIGELVRNALACAYLPVDEDSYGYCTMEAFQAGKAVLTTNDSGGVLDLVTAGSTGWVTAPDPRALAEQIELIFGNRPATRELGRAAHGHWASKGLTWERTVATLTS